eukprot:snap_masked-scaffold_1-processed-gene-7.27-mRNA-1 protein AED:1.00 eAED:1.00 QI:0/-1/0/0/-1/1/1/0/211
MMDFVPMEGRPAPKAGYKCKICGQEGGQPDSHWYQLCPLKGKVDETRTFSPPRKGYVCKFCLQPGGEESSHWFQQCPKKEEFEGVQVPHPLKAKLLQNNPLLLLQQQQEQQRQYLQFLQVQQAQQQNFLMSAGINLPSLQQQLQPTMSTPQQQAQIPALRANLQYSPSMYLQQRQAPNYGSGEQILKQITERTRGLELGDTPQPEPEDAEE